MLLTKPLWFLSMTYLCMFCAAEAAFNQGRSQEFKFGGAGAHGERGARAYNGGLGAEPPAGSRGRAPGGGSGGEALPKLKAFYLSEVVRKPQNASFGVFWKPTKIHVSTMS